MARKKKTELPPSPPAFPHSQDAHQYAKDIVSGKIPACKQAKQACQRHIDDLKASKGKDYPYKFDEEKADRPCRFIELLPHVAGKWAARKELIKLEPWQKFIVCSLFGWVKKSDGNRRFRKAYCCIPRKNAKSTISAGIGLYCLFLDGEFGAQVYAGATGEKQAAFVFDPAKKMAQSTPAILEKFGVEVNAQSITHSSSNSKFERLIGKPGDGGSPSCAIVDEYHEHGDSVLYDTMVTGTVARDQPLILVITTAGSNTGGPCYFMQRDVERMLDKSIDLPNQFGIVYTIDEGDDWTTEEALRKANPNWGVSVNIENVLGDQKEAVQSPEKQNGFKTKHMNVWCSAKSGFFNAEKWNKLGDTSLKMDSPRFLGKECVKGLDLAAQIDLAADVSVFHEDIDGVTHYFVFPRFYVPEGMVFKPENTHYQRWEKQKLLIATEGDEIDFERIKSDILKDADNYRVKELCFDKMQGLFLKQQICSASNIEGSEIPQNSFVLSDPMKWLDAMIRSGRIHHDGNEVMNWNISNVISQPDKNENEFPDKEKLEFKIDGVSALLNALVRIRAALGAPNKQYAKWNGF